MNPELSAAWATAPRLVDAEHALTRGREHLANLGPIPVYGQASARLARDITQRIRNGEALPDTPSLGQQALAARRAAEDHAAAREVLQSAVQHLEADVAEAKRSGFLAALTHLRGRLAEVLDQTRELLPALGDVRDKSSAFDAAPAAQVAWRELYDLTQQYTLIRQAQTAVTMAAAPSGISGAIGGGMTYNEARKTGLAELAGFVDIWNDTPLQNLHGDSEPPAPPWPSDADPRTGHYSPAYVAWVASTPEARAWLPDPEELADAITRAAQVRHQRLVECERELAPMRSRAIDAGLIDV